MDLLPIGSVITMESVDFLIVGYNIGVEGEQFDYQYVISRYPMGYINKRSLLSVSVKTEMEVKHRGYEGEGFQKFIQRKKDEYHLTQKMKPQEVEAGFVEAIKGLTREKDG